jgi:hypothetical protein
MLRTGIAAIAKRPYSTAKPVISAAKVPFPHGETHGPHTVAALMELITSQADALLLNGSTHLHPLFFLGCLS